MNRRKGTSHAPTAAPRDAAVVVTYRELAPAPALRGHVRAYFSFTPGGAPPGRGLGQAWSGRRAVTREVGFTRDESFCAPLFADGHASLVVELGATCRPGEGWTSGAPVGARAIGAFRRVGDDEAGSVRPAMLGVYLEPGATSTMLRVPAVELTDRVVSVDELWGAPGARLAEELAALDEAARVERLEAALLERLRRAPPDRGRGRAAPRGSVDVRGLARWVRAEPSGMTVGRLAEAAGVSRQHLTRAFREAVGVSPKRYCRLARFRAGLVYAGAGAGVPWARVAAELGYADQSHMIAEFRELSSLTPEMLATQRWFHPFILDARARHPRSPAPPVRTAI